ncbi:MAG: hypothetical protein V1820_02800 [archaeon]
MAVSIHISPGFIASVVYLLGYAAALRIFTSIVFKKITVSKTYVTMTKNDLVFVLLYLALFFNGFTLFISSEIITNHGEIPILLLVDFILRFLVAISFIGAALMAQKSELFENFA